MSNANSMLANDYIPDAGFQEVGKIEIISQKRAHLYKHYSFMWTISCTFNY